MGSCRVLENLGDGSYTVAVELDLERVKQEIAQLEPAIATLSTQIVSSAAEIIYLEEVVSARAWDLDAAVSSGEGIDDARAAYSQAQENLLAEQQKKALLELEKIDKQVRLDYNRTLPETQELTTTCADYSTELSGDVGTIDINLCDGEKNLIMPGGASGEGKLKELRAMTPAEAFFNYAVWPSVRHKPYYAIGTIHDIDTETDSCALKVEKSTVSHQDLPANDGQLISGCSITYMDCNSGPFEEGDRVVAEVAGDFTAATVIGFADGPRPCPLTISGPSEVAGQGDLTYVAAGGVKPYTFSLSCGLISDVWNAETEQHDGYVTNIGSDYCSGEAYTVVTVTDAESNTASMILRLQLGMWVLKQIISNASHLCIEENQINPDYEDDICFECDVNDDFVSSLDLQQHRFNDPYENCYSFWYIGYANLDPVIEGYYSTNGILREFVFVVPSNPNILRWPSSWFGTGTFCQIDDTNIFGGDPDANENFSTLLGYRDTAFAYWLRNRSIEGKWEPLTDDGRDYGYLDYCDTYDCHPNSVSATCASGYCKTTWDTYIRAMRDEQMQGQIYNADNNQDWEQNKVITNVGPMNFVPHRVYRYEWVPL